VRYNSATTWQNGTGNSATVQQGVGCCGTIFEHLTANVSQTGSSNVGNVTQTGFYNDALISQTGAGHIATIQQSGTGVLANTNAAAITQTGTGHRGTINQAGGAGNSATLTQN